MKLLAFDSSTANFSLALSRNGLLREENHLLGNNLSGRIIPVIKSFLKNARLSLKDINGFAVGIGPGSFTGLRIGLAVAKGLAFGLRRPLVGICSLDVLAMNAVSYAQNICCLQDAKRAKVYAAIYQNNNGRLKRLTPYLLTDINLLLKKVPPGACFIGDAVNLYRREIEKKMKARANFAAFNLNLPKGSNLAKLAQSRFRLRKFDDPLKLVPIYLYPKECQIRIKK
ncbi:MAG: tRNA (adenosine(37)-N6)-threonylcarbamoyltransferase complex dimerization subunit type 1 TsaB [Candidatus Omnitrophota bacterium]|nr:tRNA (adenosine(37)-N6)-threonylcarbamoyltransferase complex dimerization subunit type 1 TsaB [Candidatus Omnitrophota bacterium]